MSISSSQYMQQTNYTQQHQNQQWPTAPLPMAALKQQTSISGGGKQVVATAGQKQKIVRRSRQPRNPQLSVARRNERERNRVKMVNRGFADLRERLLASFVSVSSSSTSCSGDSPAPEAFNSANWENEGSQFGSASEQMMLSPSKSISDKNQQSQDSKAKKYSKVETLRAATQYIKQLTEILRQQEALESSSTGQLYTMASNMDDQLADELNGSPPSSYLAFADNPPSNSTCSNASSQQQQQTYMTQAISQSNKKFVVSTTIPSSSGQTIQWNSNNNCLVQTSSSPTNQTSSVSTPTATTTTTTLPQNTFIKLEPQSSQFSHQNYNITQHSQAAVEDQSSHTHIWIEQHQTSFMEQQQIYQQQQQQQQQQEQQWQFGMNQTSDIVQQSSVSSASPCSSTATNQTNTTTATSSANQANHTYDWYPAQQNQLSPLATQASSPGYPAEHQQQQYQMHRIQHQQQHQHHQQQPIMYHPQHQQHQISLY